MDLVVLWLREQRRIARPLAKRMLDARHCAKYQTKLDDHPQHDDHCRKREGHFDDRSAARIAAKKGQLRHWVRIPAVEVIG
jgi:hypothetical protein